ncbi:iron complex transport system substrate-binding protein [Natranaerovirga pectinivora]|uniref:Iron complex transport system substrate-binding protein n=1 Tax=Natranaerovirga pectinivora TaxID=682400 RepID=A0A4R3MQH3_9FIRM|nr:ABC transporter substrate-binding protein [Natranaerovirga pectinivora]TCT15421.1 iron complex transport system substrate-binding protein [Natranaerovirga pectinivora]
MKKILSVLLIISLGLLVIGCSKKDEVAPTIVVSDGIQEVVTNEEPEEVETLRVIAGTVASAEFLDLLDITPIGVVSTAHKLPSRYDNIPQIGTAMSPDLEFIVSLNADLYISDNGLKENIEALLEGQNLETMFLINNSFDDVMRNFEELGSFFRKEDRAGELVKEMKDKEEEILASIKNKEVSRVMIIFGTPESFMLATERSYAGGIVKKLGGINVTDDIKNAPPSPYIPFSLETVADLNPDVILRLSHAAPEATRAAFEREFAQGFWVNLDAVKNNRVYDLDNNYFGVTANVRAKDSLEKMAEILYK